jgi:hypothetical protein
VTFFELSFSIHSNKYSDASKPAHLASFDLEPGSGIYFAMASYFDPSALTIYDLSQHDTVTQGVVFNNLICMAVVASVITLRMYVRHSIKHAAGADDCMCSVPSHRLLCPPGLVDVGLCSLTLSQEQSNRGPD